MILSGTVITGSNNSFLVEGENGVLRRCGIKGKVLKPLKGCYNSLAPGDVVLLEPDPLDEERGSILGMEDRRNLFWRWNEKGKAVQAIAANMDFLACVVSPILPPFRPRFLDRVAVTAELENIPLLIVLNKSDLGLEEGTEARLEDYRRIGYEVHLCSARTGEGVESLRERIRSRTTVFVGQSGVGKSSLLNALEPGLAFRVGELSEKYERGRHTTSWSALTTLADGRTRIVDTPGFRRLAIRGISRDSLAACFPRCAPWRRAASSDWRADTRTKKAAVSWRRCGPDLSTRTATRATSGYGRSWIARWNMQERRADPAGTIPMMTNERSLELLDFPRILKDVAGYCRSDEGRECLGRSLPRTEESAVQEAKERTRAVCGLFVEGQPLPQGVFPAIGGFLGVLSKEGTCLEEEDLYALGLWAEAYGELRDFLAHARNESLAKEAREAADVSEIPRIVFRILARDGTLNDLPELREAQARVRKINMEIERITASFFQDGETRSMLQSDIPTQRDGRTVLAVRTNFKGKVKGIVHEVSDTGRTVFIEPEALVRKNNELVEATARYRQEVFRILKEATAKASAQLPRLLDARESCESFDDLWARARYSFLNRGTFAQNRETGLTLRRARHPMLGSQAVPIDLDIPGDVRTLVITGPNTGGKTVSLKTVGLLCLMNQFGLAVPAEEGTSLPVLDGVYADIGDEQSIDQSLSTFSGHMKAVSGIVGGATSRSLVLLDELGSGTDPEEGCAIAMSLLDHFIETGCLTIVTTHHGILKNYGYTRAGVLNASADFDKNTLSPTYRILMGIPGESRALEIAARNGLPGDIVSGARRYLAEERTDVAAMIQGLSEKRRELEGLEEEHKRRIRMAMEDQRKTDLKALQLRQKEAELREQGIRDLNLLLAESRKGLENLVRQLREGELTAEKTRAVKEFLGNLDTAVKAEEARRETDSPEPSPPPEAGGVREGSAVFVGTVRKRGRVIRRAKKGYWLVEAGSLRIAVPETELQPCREESSAVPSVTVDVSAGSSAKAVFELDLRGYRLAEALRAVEAQLEAASLASLSLFSIIHGTGEGVLGKGIHELLRNHPAVKDYYFARPEEGGFGKTVVHLA